jgi:hypothetical protein
MSLMSVGSCQVEVTARSDHSPREILPSVVCLNVIVNHP